MTALGDKITKHRERLGWSRQDLAVNAGLHNTYVSHLEDGLMQVPVQIMAIAVLARALGISPLVLAAAAFDDLGCEFPASASEDTSAGGV